jgi:DNA-damage-inducible protein D
MNDNDTNNDGNDDNDGQGILPFDDGSAGRVIRRVWHNGRWFFSVVDVVAVLTDSDAPRNYWADMKRRIQDEGFIELLAKCQQLKMRSPLDGKMYKTDAADTETMLRITMSIPSPKAEPVRQWLAQVGAQRLNEVVAELDENQRRLLLRGEFTERNNRLMDAASAAGIISQRDFAIFQDFGYKGLYNGETARDIAARKGLAKGERILDHMGSTELGANIFRATATDDVLRRMQAERPVGQTEANATHYAVGKEIRGLIERIGGTMPEALPTPEQSIQQLEREERERAQARLQPPLIPPHDGGAAGSN